MGSTFASSLVPTDSRVLIQHISAEETTDGGIVLPTSTHSVLTKAKILAAGPGRILNTGIRSPMTATSDKIGSNVLVKVNSGIQFGTGIALIDDSEILGFVG